MLNRYNAVFEWIGPRVWAKFVKLKVWIWKWTVLKKFRLAQKNRKIIKKQIKAKTNNNNNNDNNNNNNKNKQ